VPNNQDEDEFEKNKDKIIMITLLYRNAVAKY